MDGWKIYVDGKATDYDSYNDALILLPLNGGTHDVEIRFLSPGIIAGMIIGILSFILFAVLINMDHFDHIFNRRKIC